ncbi:src-like-adapter [Paramormyrops kingsleyae]|uniref:Src like adaptor n=1 Tax=Paramormyrops kingsleyae TaxID=1676925 RepID=A0A3B3QHI4_9TELE|nr:src-like-adapter isoform X1 [Paramormyrops kingsleyae]
MGNAEAGAAVADSAGGTAETAPLCGENGVLFVLEDYPPPNLAEPIFKTGEKLQVLSEQDGWLQVRCLEKEDYIPKHHTGNIYRGWLFEGVSRDKAEELLELPGHRPGSFMIRKSLSNTGMYSLSVWNNSVKHYRIFCQPNNSYYIFPRMSFHSLDDLVGHYSESAEGLCCPLTTPCLASSSRRVDPSSQAPPVVMRCKFDWKNVDRSGFKSRSLLLSPESRDSALSFGLRSSMATYVSLTGQNGRSKTASQKAKRGHQLEEDELIALTGQEDGYQQPC